MPMNVMTSRDLPPRTLGTFEGKCVKCGGFVPGAWAHTECPRDIAKRLASERARAEWEKSG